MFLCCFKQILFSFNQLMTYYFDEKFKCYILLIFFFLRILKNNICEDLTLLNEKIVFNLHAKDYRKNILDKLLILKKHFFFRSYSKILILISFKF